MRGIFQVLADDEMVRLHGGALRLLDETGIRIENATLLAALERRGARIDWPSQRAHIPRSVVDEVLSPEPNRGLLTCTVVSRGPGGPYWTGGIQPQYLDWRTHKRRHGTRRIAREILSALHGMPEVGGFGTPITMVDVPAPMEPIESVAMLMTQTDRPGGVEVLHADNVKYLVELGEIFSGKPGDFRFVASCNFVVPPLIMGARCAACIVEKTRFNIPGIAGTMPVSGATAPVTRAGTAAIEIAETVACWLCHRVLSPELPLGGILCSGSMDMRTGRCLFGSPEAVVQDAMAIQTLKWLYDIDTGTSAAYVDPKQPGIQAAFDKVFKILAAGALTGGFGGGGGLLDAGKVWSPVQFVLDWDILDSVSALLRRVEVTEETLAVDLIHDVARSNRRAFLDTDHTAECFRKALWHPHFFDRTEWQGDVRERHRDAELLGKARDRWADAVRDAPGYTLDADRMKAVRKVLRRARKELLAA